jgi:hypothetical protein
MPCDTNLVINEQMSAYLKKSIAAGKKGHYLAMQSSKIDADDSHGVERESRIESG